MPFQRRRIEREGKSKLANESMWQAREYWKLNEIQAP